MRIPTELYRPPLALLTDLYYELTMAYGYGRSGLADHEAVFHHTFRKNPFGGGFSVACGLAYAVDYLERLSVAPADLAYLAELRGADGAPLFASDFLEYLRDFRFRCDVDAIPEGTVVFPHEPLVRVRGLATFHAGIKRFVNPHSHSAGLEKGLHELRTRLVLEARPGI